MYLKSIEVNGFKSFANKILFDFNEGITAIVGPNGSGKSNVGDAVRWVLGEQSAKQLRGSKMEDVIFSGTEVRKPQSSAYVAITLDNSDHSLPIDFNEVKVARRVFRSGESEYLINGNACRLKDVQELFFDTGIGKEGYSIIGQGQVEKILSGKPEERRELFDEAAGIVKFKKRKKTAEKNLEEERLNLSRINDILKELEHQVAPLEKQSKVAKEYLDLREQLKTFEVNLFLNDYDRINDSSTEVESKLEIAKNQLEEATRDFDKTKDEYERLDKEIEERNNTIDEVKNRLSDSKVNKEKEEGNIKLLKEQLTALNNNNEMYKSRITAINEELEAKNKDLNQYKSEFEENEDKIQELSEKKENLDSEKNSDNSSSKDANDEIEKLQNSIYDIMNSESEVKTQIERLETLLEQNNLKKVELNQKLLQQKTKENDMKSIVTSCENELKEINDSIAEQNELNQYKINELNDVNNTLKKNNEELNNAIQSRIKESSRLESLKNMTERYEGYGNSIKKVMEKKDQISGIYGVVADIIKTESKYEQAIEIALGGSIQNIVTDNENTAKNLIEYLKKNKFGRATFLPLTTVKPKGSFNNDSCLKEKGVIGLCHTLINTDKMYKDLIESLVGRVVVVDNIDNAISIQRKYNNSIKIVTLEGDLLNPGGSMSGGAFKNSSNLLGRRREIDDIEETIAKLNKTIDKIKEENTALNDKANKLSKIIENNKNNLQELYIKQNSSKHKLDQANKDYNELTSFYENISKETTGITDTENDLKSKINSLNTKFSEFEELKSGNNSKINELNDKLVKIREDEQNRTDMMSSIISELSKYEQTRQFIMENTRRVSNEIDKLKKEQEGINDELSNMDNLIKDKSEEIENSSETLETLERDIESFSKEIDELVSKREEVLKQHKMFFSKREELSASMTSLDKEIFRLNSQKDKLSEQLDSCVSYMWDEYELTYGSALPLKKDDMGTYQQIKKKVSELKTSIKALGDVNVNAIEDYKNIVERYETLKTQHDDLIESEKVLVKIIEDLDVEMRKQFEEKFAYIKKQFDIVFKELFGGGKGNLELMEDEDVLEAGIRIIAQPPGKKLQNMMQMSGGEKSLTAIALLFAIQNLKPSPFCLLDEIEAALDDANVKRYAEYLKKLTKHTQFIVITHRRGTMGAADILYGITMQEKGVSTLVSVNLIEDKLDK
ncbi:MAG: chromosome segregation protein SMC [Lachnospiraceae bacterium]|nr:chromosome segregation protein SMC [Lachnospiraceae bacterium]